MQIIFSFVVLPVIIAALNILSPQINKTLLYIFSLNVRELKKT